MTIRFKLLHATVFTCLLSLTALASASAQLAPTQKAPRNVPLETYDNPPAPPRKIETSPQMISRFGSFTSYQVNVNASGQNILGDAANECSISVDPTNGNKMTIAWRQFDNVTSNFRQAGWGYTTNGGINWIFPGVLENNVFRSDPVTNSDEIGQFFYLSLQSDINTSFFCDDLWRSTNGGQSWILLSGERGGGGGDKQWFTIDKTNGPGHGFQYQSDDGINCSGGGVEFQRSTNGGVTWQAPITIPHAPVYGTLDVDTNGNLFIGGEGSTFYCVRSSNAQIGGQTPVFDQSTAVNMGGFLGSGGINPAGLDGMVFLAVDRSSGATNNNIYMLASVVPSGRSTTDVMFVRSTDGGLTFSAPHKVNDDPVNPSKWHWFGTFSVAPNGRLDAVWYDTRNAANNTDSQLFYSWSTDAGVTWAPNAAVSDAFNPFEGYPNQSKIGDYITIVSDNTGANVAYSATFNFNSSRGQHEEDVYYVRVAPSATSGINLVSAASRLTHGAAGTFDIAMPLTGVSGVEDRTSSTYNAVFTFDAPVTSGEVTVLSGTATVGAISFSGNSMTAQLTGVTSAEVVTLHVQNINGDGLPHGDVPFGFLTADVNSNRIVDRPDQQQIQANRNQPITASNFRDDINLSGAVDRPDLQSVQTNRGHSIP
jgi:hypothetical protein